MRQNTFGVHPNSIARVLNGSQKALRMYNRDENGNRIGHNIGTCRLTYAAHMETAMDAVMESGRNAHNELNKVKAENEEMKHKLSFWNNIVAKLKECKKAKEKVMRRKRMVERKQEEYQLALARLQEAEREYAELLKGVETLV